MLFAFLFLVVYCVSLSIMRSDSVSVSEFVDLSELSLGALFDYSESLGCGGSRFIGFVRQPRRVRVSVGVVVRGRSGRRLGGAARSARLRRLVELGGFSERLAVRSVSRFVAEFRAQVALQRRAS